MTSETRNQRQERKRAEAEVRQAAHDKLTLDQKLAKARKRGGPQCKEYQRLEASR